MGRIPPEFFLIEGLLIAIPPEESCGSFGEPIALAAAAPAPLLPLFR